MNQMKLIGIGADGKASLPAIYKQWIDECERLIGGERQLAFFPDYVGEKITIRNNLSSLLTTLMSEPKKTVILASGDPLFYGIGSYLAKKVPIEVYPSVSSLQWAFAKMGESWHDAYVVSLHGRSMKGLAQRIDGKEKVAILTDETNNPRTIASYLLEYEMTEYEAFVGENLGGENERCRFFTLEEMKEASFAPLNIVVLRRVNKGPSWTFGIDDEEFWQRKPEKGLITKKEVRVLSLQALHLHDKSVVWDIGTCTGSVAIEAAKIAREGAVFAVEKNALDIEICQKNMKKFRVDFTLVHGRAPEQLAHFPEPDAIFIGGTSGSLRDIIDVCCARLKKDGRIVINAVTIETLYEATDALRHHGYAVDILLAQFSRSKPILQLTRFDALNPIYIISARKGESK
ncbi:bifunctional cobalt-precorrin-7 (C(5))-methyltransferase/cobalt-precorrin-6B (C(15))-methyltransferase [Anoxybacillus flavithermus]|uniref:Bifunctional cobalt-precorrin-7 (C(5))-methyltransferase/cobalt-precorrin-6B (C(15))-methyltransferase n=1 Tax=Anoxybacillus flavithermus TaxID=33934 RepID=A0A2G5RTD7_9BACL|nr:MULTISPECIES: bifunctional cobalt-precorrin-7 (C(5))-methyltransferase/cobalt-precorrin-6B (C(15))-methyltransferase [Anoxybacillus]KFZ43808.1 cobalamin biosynthesis protein CbiE [Anoxybacillus sp. KU2-6(11)]PIC05942.1 bifunctional cobalt-precorrin-7 (C(5))-methyltransferase/cobalt-precorrin-6B (C(15))-methyltransferase [Anoxybacillus flavithermus]